MAQFAKRNAIGYHMFLHQQEMRYHRHRILQLKSKINLTSQLIRTNARTISNTNDENIITFNREVQFKTQLEDELYTLNYNELKPQETYAPGQLRPKANCMQRTEDLNMRRRQLHQCRLQRQMLKIKQYKNGQECGNNAPQLNVKQRTLTEKKPNCQDLQLEFAKCHQNTGADKCVKRRLEFEEQQQPVAKRYRTIEEI